MKRAIRMGMGLWGFLAVLSAAAGGISLFVSNPLITSAVWLAACLAVLGLGGVLRQLLKGLEDLERYLKNPDCMPVSKGTWSPSFWESLQKWSARQQTQAEETRQENSRLRLQLQLLERQRTWEQAVLDSIRDAVLVVNEDNQILFANPAARELLNPDAVPEHFSSLETIETAAALREKIHRCRSGRIRHVRHELALNVQGQQRIFEAVFSCLPESSPNSGGVVAVLHDISREREISQMKNEFVSHVSHELKTPLASINAYAEMLVDGEAQDADTIRQFCSIIQSQSLRLNRLIEDILNISRIESGLVKVNRSNHSIALIVRDAVEMIRSYAQEKNITIHAPAPILYDQACVDRDMISQAVINLLSNAVKYTPAGGSVTVGLEVDEAEGRLRVTVTDTGVGIPPEELGRVFEKFYRVQANNHMAKGTGLGLNLVKQIIETVHGGRVFVSSVVGQGSIFGFELPLALTGCAAASVGGSS
ncbi:MAG TPA: ATP-binding protein [Anaerohalosphaeraceae bacterium]|nr:ATP-binding protein [Anaerohalosphaeraceae bacterium]